MSFDGLLVGKELTHFARAAYPMKWIRANQEGDRPARPYGTFLISTADPIGFGDIVEEADGIQIKETMREVFEFSVSFQAIGKNAVDIMAALKEHARRRSTVIGTLQTCLIGFMSASETRDLAVVLAAGWENRAQADFIFSVRFDSTLSIDTVDSVDILGAVGTQTTSQTVEIP